MLFSIIIPVFNSKDVINYCIESVKNQSEDDYEVIIIDDGSTDGSTDDIENYLEGIKSKIIRVPNGGVSFARNIGLDIAKGEYIIFLDVDDQIPDNTLAIYKKWIVKEGYPDILFSGFYRIYPKKVSSFKLETNGKNVLIYDEINQEFQPFMPRFSGCVWGKCYKRNMLEKERFDISLSLCEDAEFNFRVFEKANKMIYINYYLYKYVYSLNSTIRKYNPDYIVQYIKAIEKMNEYAIEKKSYEFYLQFASNVFNVICFNVIFAEQNKMSNCKKYNIIHQIRRDTIFKKIIDDVDLSQLPLKHRVVIWLSKRERYYMIYFISIVNNVVNKFLY